MANIPGYEIFGGATITREHDNDRSNPLRPNGNEYIGLTARNLADKSFGFRIFRNRVEVRLQSFCTGRGSVSKDGNWIATTEDPGGGAGSEFHGGTIPGWVH